MKKISKRYSGILLGVLMPIVMGFIMSFVVTAINLGFDSQFLAEWMHAYSGVLLIGIPVGFIVTPPLKTLVDKITR